MVEMGTKAMREAVAVKVDMEVEAVDTAGVLSMEVAEVDLHIVSEEADQVAQGKVHKPTQTLDAELMAVS